MIVIPKGTKDILAKESYKWHYLENIIRELTSRFGVREVRTPTFEHTEVFLRGVGDTTDIVNKEMYTFFDKGNRSITLKAEGTAGVARSFIENNLINDPLPLKMYYLTPVFRYEKPQNGRLREHHQFGIEYFGSSLAAADVEVMLIAKTLFDRLGITELTLNINSIGCPTCRKIYNEALCNFLQNIETELCPTCKERLTKNPLRVLDCKDEHCIELTKNAPIVLDYLCDDCQGHHDNVKSLLTTLDIDFVVNPKIVRGLDYYTRTVFEFVSTAIGSQGTVCGGGRYNGLVTSLGGKECPAVGFGMGLERLLLVLENTGKSVGNTEIPLVYIAPIGEPQYIKAALLVKDLRDSGVSVDTDLMNKGIKAQMKYADKMGYKYVIVLGENEVSEGIVELKNMIDGTKETIAINNITKRLAGE